MKKMKNCCGKAAQSDGMDVITASDSGNYSSFSGEIYWL
jgi:hypothetical protein